MKKRVDDQVNAAVRERADGGTLNCTEAFKIAEELEVRPLAVGQAADNEGVRLARCQLGFFGYGATKSVVEPLAEVSAELEQAIREGLILGQLPCAVAWGIARRFGLPKLSVSGAAEKLGVRVGQCQLDAF